MFGRKQAEPHVRRRNRIKPPSPYHFNQARYQKQGHPSMVGRAAKFILLGAGILLVVIFFSTFYAAA